MIVLVYNNIILKRKLLDFVDKYVQKLISFIMLGQLSFISSIVIQVQCNI